MAKKKARRSHVTVRIPEAAWDLLAETLRMDSKSSAFDPDLRREIAEAYESVRLVRTEEIPIGELREAYGPDYAGSGKTGPKEWSPREKVVTLRVPEDAWSMLTETLYLDSESGAFDDDLRKAIAAALELIIEE